VVDATDFSAAQRHVGDRVEVVGRIVAVEPGLSPSDDGVGRPFVNVNFAPSTGGIVTIAVWSEGLDRLTEMPSNSLVGRWASVTGLIEPARAGREAEQLSMTVEQLGQLQWLSEREAKFRLASIGKPPPRRNRDIVRAVAEGR